MTLQIPAKVNDGVKGTIQSVARIVVGFLFACHGAANLFGILVPSHHTMIVGAWPSWYAAMIELIGGLLVAFGLFTRTAAVIGSGSMAFAYFTVHQVHGLLPIQNSGEPAAMFCWALLLIAVVGAGPLAVDSFVARRREAATTRNTLSVTGLVPQPVA